MLIGSYEHSDGGFGSILCGIGDRLTGEEVAGRQDSLGHLRQIMGTHDRHRVGRSISHIVESLDQTLLRQYMRVYPANSDAQRIKRLLQSLLGFSQSLGQFRIRTH